MVFLVTVMAWTVVHDAKVVMDDLGERTKEIVVQESLLTILRELSYISWFTPITNMWASAKGAKDDDLLGSTLHMSPSHLHGGRDPSRHHNILSTSITPFDVGEISLLEDRGGLSIEDKLPTLSFYCTVQFAMLACSPCSSGQ